MMLVSKFILLAVLTASLLVISLVDCFSTSGPLSHRHKDATSHGFKHPLLATLVQDPAPSFPESTQKHGETINAAKWHQERRRQMLAKYGDQIAPLERESTSQLVGLPLLLFTCSSLWALTTLVVPSLPIWGVVLLSIFPGSILSLWQLQLLHDVIHGSMLEKGSPEVFSIPKQKLQDKLLFWGSLPCVFGYYLYLKVGHLSHHRNIGNHSLDELFASDKYEFEDGDLLFVAHRMNLNGDYGPQIPIPFTDDKKFKMSISKSGFYFWKEGAPIANAIFFTTSFMYERLLLVINDAFVAILGKNLFFANKPNDFQVECTEYARVATAIRAALLVTFGWKPLLFLYLSETLWSIPPHPSCAMFVTNHGSDTSSGTTCVPTKSTYAGLWYSLLTLGTNFHCEHHDFPTIPFHKLHKLRKIAPEFYPTGSDDDLLQIMDKTFAHPEFYACMDAGIRRDSQTDV